MRVGRFILYEPFAAGGGGASLHLACMTGEGDFRRIVAVKQLARSAAADGAEGAAALAELLDEARIAARVHHTNVVDVLELCATEDGVFLAMEYVHGATLAELALAARARGQPIPVELACTLVADVLHGLHAAHATTAPTGELAGVVHRDVSPDNILVGADGIARIGDFGIAKSGGRFQTTAVGQVKGKLGYVAPERLLEDEVTPLCDVYGAGVVLFELLAGRSPFSDTGDDRDARIGQVLEGIPSPPSQFASVPGSLDLIVRRATAVRPEERFPDARAFATALEGAAPRWSPRRVGAWVEELAAEPMAARARRIEELLAEEQTTVREASPTTPGPEMGGSRPVARRLTPALAALVAAALGLVALAAAALRDPAPDVQVNFPTGASASQAALLEPPSAPLEPAVPAPSAVDPPAPPPKPARAAPPERSGCTPPYRIDAQGIRRWKKGCTE